MNSLTIPISFCLMAAFLLWFVIGSKGNWLFKTIMVMIYLYYGILIWFSLDTYLGWPSKDQLPSKYIVYWAEIQEPDPNSEGVVYLWVSELDSKESFTILGYNNKKGEPRVYELYYTKSFHKKIQDMLENIKKGSVYIGGNQNTDDFEYIELNPFGKNDKFNFSHNSRDQYLFPLPPAKLPEKVIK
jgi:hypothetical protein